MNRVDVLDHASQLAQKFPRTLALFAEGCAA